MYGSYIDIISYCNDSEFLCNRKMTKLKKEEGGANKHEMKRWRKFFNVLQNDLVNRNN